MQRSTSVHFLPAPRFAVVDRAVIIADALAEPRAALVLLHGPAGIGKTTAMGQIAMAMASLGDRVVWVRLRADDVGRERFWMRVLDVLDRAGVLEGTPVLEALHRGGLFGADSVPTLIEAFAGLPTSVTIALDDFHLVASAELDRDLLDLLTTTAAVRLLISGRSLGSLTRSSVRSAVTTRTIDNASLSFTVEQTARLIEVTTGLVEPATLQSRAIAVHAETKGWALATMALSADRGALATSQHPASSAAFVRDYVDQLLSDASAQERRVLLLTSVIDEISPDLAARLTGVDAQVAARIL